MASSSLDIVQDSEAGPSTAVDEAGMDLDTPITDIVPQIQNVVATVNLGCKLDLKHIALSARNAEYNPKRFAAVIMRIKDPKTTALIFASGKMVCTGAKSRQFSREAAKKYAKIIQKLGFDARFKEFKIQNIVASCDVKFPIRLEGLSIMHVNFANYEPELFPGLIYKMKRPKIVLLIFVSGKVVLTGAKEESEITTAFHNILPVLQQFRKGDAQQADGLLPGSEDAQAMKAPMADEGDPVEALPGPSHGHDSREPMLGQEDEGDDDAGPQMGIIPPPSPAIHAGGHHSRRMSSLPPPMPYGHPLMAPSPRIPPPSPAHFGTPGMGTPAIPPPSPAIHNIPPPSPAIHTNRYD